MGRLGSGIYAVKWNQHVGRSHNLRASSWLYLELTTGNLDMPSDLFIITKTNQQKQCRIKMKHVINSKNSVAHSKTVLRNLAVHEW